MNSKDSLSRRAQALNNGNSDLQKRAALMELCRRDPVFWCNHFLWVYDPRELKRNPFDLWPKQVEMIRFIRDRSAKKKNVAIEKSRDTGATYVCAMNALHQWLFVPNYSAFFSSHSQEALDERGNTNSIFEKIRYLIKSMPWWMRPAGMTEHEHDNQGRIINPVNGNAIVGSVGDNSGRGGRVTEAYPDEAAFWAKGRLARFYANASALTDFHCSITTPNGPERFFEEVQSGRVETFRITWRDDPRKDDAWAAKKRASMTDRDWRCEYEISYETDEGEAIIPREWIDSSARLRARLSDYKPAGPIICGLDVGGGSAETAIVACHGPLVLETRILDADPITAAWQALDYALEIGATEINYDPLGPGPGVQAIFQRVEDDPSSKYRGIALNPINVGLPTPRAIWINDDQQACAMYPRIKAFLWYSAAGSLRRAHELLAFLEGRKGGFEHPVESCILIGGDNLLARQLSTPRKTRDERGLAGVESKKSLAARGVPSHDRADAFLQSRYVVYEYGAP